FGSRSLFFPKSGMPSAVALPSATMVSHMVIVSGGAMMQNRSVKYIDERGARPKEGCRPCIPRLYKTRWRRKDQALDPSADSGMASEASGAPSSGPKRNSKRPPGPKNG